jgi:hypothetical protein
MTVLTIRALGPREGIVRCLILATVFVALLLPGVATALSPSAALANFPTDAQAQQHCPANTVVWLNLPTGIYHLKGERWYGQTKSGAFVCLVHRFRISESMDQAAASI